jgi:Tectonin domain
MVRTGLFHVVPLRPFIDVAQTGWSPPFTRRCREDILLFRAASRKRGQFCTRVILKKSWFIDVFLAIKLTARRNFTMTKPEEALKRQSTHAFLSTHLARRAFLQGGLSLGAVLLGETPVHAMLRGSKQPSLTDAFHFESGEHTAIGDGVYLFFYNGDSGTRAGSNPLTLPNGLSLTYGQIIALGGDFYGLPDAPISDGSSVYSRKDRFTRAFNTLATDAAAVKEVAQILDVMQIEINDVNVALFNGTPASAVYATLGDSLSEKWNVITGGGSPVSPLFPLGRYLKLTAKNWDHFGQYAVLAYQAGHAVALDQAVIAHTSQQQSDLELAFAMSAFADHFLSDLFSSGHLRTPRKELYYATTIGATGSLLSRYMHNEDSRCGLNVSNQRGEVWRAYGDDRYFDTVNNENKIRVDQAVQVSVDEIFTAFLTGVPLTDPTLYLALTCIPNLQEVQDYTNNVQGNTSPLFISDAAGVWPRLDYNNPADREWPHTYWTGPTLLADFKGLNRLYPKYVLPDPLPGHVVAPTSAPSIAGWNSSTSIQPDWVSGNGVRYAVSYIQGIEESDLGPWSSWTTLTNSFEPTLQGVPTDPAGIATARRIYRQFAEVNGQRPFTAPIGIIADATSTTFADSIQTTQAWQQIPGGGVISISVGSDGAVWAIVSNGGIYRYIRGSQTWQNIYGTLASISVGNSGAVWGVQSNGNIYKYVGGSQTWQQIDGTLASISVGSDGTVWGVQSSGSIYKYVGGSQTWQQINGTLASISVGNSGVIWGVQSNGSIFRYVGSSQTWQQIAGTLANISVGGDGAIWGVQSNGNVFTYVGGSQIWQQIVGSLSQVSVGSALNIWGLDSQQRIFTYVPFINLTHG